MSPDIEDDYRVTFGFRNASTHAETIRKILTEHLNDSGFVEERWITGVHIASWTSLVVHADDDISTRDLECAYVFGQLDSVSRFGQIDGAFEVKAGMLSLKR